MIEQLLNDDSLFAALYQPAVEEERFLIHHKIAERFQRHLSDETTYWNLYDKCLTLRRRLRGLRLIPVIYHVSQSEALEAIRAKLPCSCTENRLAYKKNWLNKTLSGLVVKKNKTAPNGRFKRN
jgi:hypothetical protein